MSLNGPAVVNGNANNYDRDVCFDAPVGFDTGLFVDAVNIRTLASLRNELMVRLGFAAMVGNPPPGMTELLNSFLQDAQEQLHTHYAVMRNERWWGWQATAGKRFYDVPIDCTKYLDVRRVTAAFVADNGGRVLTKWVSSTALALGSYIIPRTYNGFEYEVTVAGTTAATEPVWPTTLGATVVSGTVTFTCRERAESRWYELRAGIDPHEYSRDTITLRPQRYELREYLEIFPAPDQAYIVWLKGHLGVRPFAADTDPCTVDARPLFLFALANAKAHYGQPDARRYDDQVTLMKRKLVAGSHGTKRYIPGEQRAEDRAMPRRV